MTSNTTTILRFQRPSRGCEIQVVRLSSSDLAPNYVGSGKDPSMLQKAGNKDGLKHLNVPQVSVPVLLEELDCRETEPYHIFYFTFLHGPKSFTEK